MAGVAGVGGVVAVSHQLLNGSGNVAVAEVEDAFHLRATVKRKDAG